MKRLRTCALLFLIVLASAADASLRLIPVEKGSATAEALRLSVETVRDRYFPDSPVITIKTREDGALKTMFGAGLRVAEGRRHDIKSLTVDVPLDARPPFRTKPGLVLKFRLHDSLVRDATVYFRCGTPYSEELYEIRLSDFVSPAPARR